MRLEATAADLPSTFSVESKDPWAAWFAQAFRALQLASEGLPLPYERPAPTDERSRERLTRAWVSFAQEVGNRAGGHALLGKPWALERLEEVLARSGTLRPSGFTLTTLATLLMKSLGTTQAYAHQEWLTATLLSDWVGHLGALQPMDRNEWWPQPQHLVWEQSARQGWTDEVLAYWQDAPALAAPAWTRLVSALDERMAQAWPEVPVALYPWRARARQAWDVAQAVESHPDLEALGRRWGMDAWVEVPVHRPKVLPKQREQAKAIGWYADASVYLGYLEHRLIREATKPKGTAVGLGDAVWQRLLAKACLRVSQRLPGAALPDVDLGEAQASLRKSVGLLTTNKRLPAGSEQHWGAIVMASLLEAQMAQVSAPAAAPSRRRSRL